MSCCAETRYVFRGARRDLRRSKTSRLSGRFSAEIRQFEGENVLTIFRRERPLFPTPHIIAGRLEESLDASYTPRSIAVLVKLCRLARCWLRLLVDLCSGCLNFPFDSVVHRHIDRDPRFAPIAPPPSCTVEVNLSC